jgi:hypothetical protein
VYDPATGSLVHLTELPPGRAGDTEIDFVGPSVFLSFFFLYG